MVGAGLGVAFLPASAWRVVPESEIVRLHIEEPGCMRTIGLAWREDRYLSVAARTFRQFVIDYFAQME
jgi:LysR family transcriptional activator of glutamate synthase operon